MKNLLLLSFFTVILFSCGKGPETVTVKSDPFETVERDTTFQAPETNGHDDFIQLNLAEFGTIESLDPLFAESNSEFRIVHLLYNGLAALDEDGNIEPALAKNWEVNNDSTRFTFHLRRDVVFHDVDIFSGGVGRKFVSSDVRYIFERMASLQVPDYAAEMFSIIQGFKAYQNEQFQVKNTAKHAFETIKGIDVQDDSTVVFTLNESSADFLEMLAHPYASIYAKESVANPPIQKAAGTGAFYFVKKGSNQHILSVNKDYHGKTHSLNRLDIFSGLSKDELLEKLDGDEIDVIIEPDPSTVTQLLNSAGELSEEYSGRYTLDEAPVNAVYNLYYNEDSGQEAIISKFLSALNTDDIFENQVLGSISLSEPDTTNSEEINNGQLIIAQTSHPAEVYLINRVLEQATGDGLAASMSPSYAITEEVTLSTRSHQNASKILEWNTPLFIIIRNTISGIKINSEPWNIDVSNISVSEEI